jgi:FkbM family methyltransferase
VEPQLRRAQRVLESPTVRRDRRDSEHVRLLMRLSLAADANCVDVGANVGDVLSEIVEIAPQGRHVAFEPLPDLARRLAERFPQVDVRASALSDEPGEAVFHRVKHAHSRSGLSARDHGDTEVERFAVHVETLDAALPADYRPALVKIDVEGAEVGLLRGATRVLEAHRPTLVIEHSLDASAHFGTTTRDVHELLSARGYRVFDIDGNGPLSLAGFEATTRAGRIWTFVAHG